jgi:2-dehydro-3-deoxygalactonokinase
VLADVCSDRGASRIAAEIRRPEDREAAFVRALADLMADLADSAACDLNGIPVVASGMVTSQHGWRDIPYARLPLDLPDPQLPLTRFNVKIGTSTHPILLVPGLRSDCDVMRGEECELLGLAQTPGWDGRATVVLLPGTHCKHVSVVENRVVNFTTYMTGELFEAFVEHTVLGRTATYHSGGRLISDRPAFQEGVRDAVRDGLSASLFRVRSRALLDHTLDAAAGGAYLDGLLVGDELARFVAERPRHDLWLCAGAQLTDVYRAAADELGLGGTLHCLPPEAVDRLAVLGHCVLLERSFS